MADTPRFEPMEESNLFPNGTSARIAPDGTLAREDWDENPSISTGVDPATGNAAEHSPLPYTKARIERGRLLFNIHCAVCHGEDGYAKGIIVRRGFPSPPSYHTERLRNAPDGHLFDVITNGYGRMYPFRGTIKATDRWAVVSYIRALQRGQHATLDDIADPEMRKKLEQERSGS
ncbi:cytochrome c [Luteolibacter pohnpeiensis]|uniref:Cytochrome c n=2 Tax=Luteolibacter pohnpeiensis TaxID=454153 RepID=A0A934SA01_9BACT|nr:cytochrome c [Luteolibacter pohnpeiensis]